MSQFSELGLSGPLLKALAAEGYTTPTPIQAQAVPVVLGGRDLLGLAQTGAGKTAAFALPILQRLAENRRHGGPGSARALVLAPTRELAAQIGQSFRAYGRFLGLATAVVYGGASMYKQRESLSRGVDILVATPGRLLDHVEGRTARLDGVEILVLDEADHMLDLGFIHALRRISKLLPRERQTLFFSATMPEPIAALAAQFASDPVQIAVTPVASTSERVDQAVIHTSQSAKTSLLIDLLRDAAISRALVFTRTKHGANRLVEKLLDAGLSADAIHGNKSQGQRERALAAFKNGRARLLVATEIAARGIDVDDVTHVINFDLPNVPEQYVHRIGRTARAGKSGSAISFCAPDERSYLRDIERLIRMSVPVRTHALSAAQGPDDRAAAPAGAGRNAGAKARPSGHKRNGGPPHGQRQRPEGQKRERAEGQHQDRRGREGVREVWSNGPSPDRPPAKRRRGA
jgi:ATP-dependent RNA helicase RhlE